MVQCAAKSKQTGVRCKRHATPGMKVCYYHGGHSLKGMANPAFKHGKYSKYLPAGLLEKYQASTHDERLLELREEISLIDARLLELLGMLDTGEAGSMWIAAREAFAKLRKSMVENKPAEMAEALGELDTSINKGNQNFALWSEINETIDQRRKLVESERKRLVEMQQLISAEQANMIIAGLSAVVKKYVTDPPTFARIYQELIQFALVQSGTIIEAQ